MVKNNFFKIMFFVLIPILLVSLGINILNYLQPRYVIGIVDHKSIGTGTGGSGEPVEWHTVSLWLVTEDEMNGFQVGDTIAYIVDEGSYAEIMVGDVIKASLQKDLRIDVIYIERKKSLIIWERSGGFIGLDEKIVINEDGIISYNSSLFGDGKMELLREEYEQLVGKLNYFTGDVSFDARPDVADYYIYRITIKSALGTRVIEWVDGWASKEPVPREVGEIELHFLSIVERLCNDDSTQSAGERAEQIAKEFIVQAPTFKFDGLIETVNIIETRILESFPVQYIVLIEFESRHTGYGDRTGQFLPQVITSHHAEIKVVNDNVLSAILDDQWDEINQKQLD